MSVQQIDPGGAEVVIAFINQKKFLGAKKSLPMTEQTRETEFEKFIKTKIKIALCKNIYNLKFPVHKKANCLSH